MKQLQEKMQDLKIDNVYLFTNLNDQEKIDSSIEDFDENNIKVVSKDSIFSTIHEMLE